MLLSKNLLLLPALILGLTACGDKPKDVPAVDDPAKAADAAPAEDDHHNEVSIGTVEIGGAVVGLAQGHGKMKAGDESHLDVKLPTNDRGATIVRAWVGTSDRTKSLVAKGAYDASHNDYDVHADAPDPLPEGVQWWIEIEKPDGTKAVGSANPILE